MGQSHPDREFERVLQVTGPVNLDASLDAGVIRVKRGNAGAVEVRGILREQQVSLFGISFSGWANVEERLAALQANPPVEQSGNTIRLGFLNGVSQRGISLLLEVTVPYETRFRGHSDSADFHVEEIQGPVECETDSGVAEVAGIDSEVRVTTDSGRVTLRNIKGPVRLQTDSGGIEAAEIAGRFDAETDSSSTRLSQTVAAPVYIRSDGGDVRVELAPEAGYDIVVGTDNGQITVPPFEADRTDEDRVRGKLRGGGTPVDIATDSGSIEIF